MSSESEPTHFVLHFISSMWKWKKRIYAQEVFNLQQTSKESERFEAGHAKYHLRD